MNELISNLVDKTAKMMPGVYTVEYESGKKGVEFNEEALNRFVELIVQQCVSLCEDLKFQNSQYLNQENDFSVKNIYAERIGTCTFLQQRMKQSFGVE